MASSKQTPNTKLSQFAASDRPTIIGDYNGDMLKIDRAVTAVKTTATEAQSTANAAKALAQQAAGNVVWHWNEA